MPFDFDSDGNLLTANGGGWNFDGDGNLLDGTKDKKEQDGPLKRGYNAVSTSVSLTKDLAAGNYDSAAKTIADQARYNAKNPGSEASIGLQKAWQEGDGISGGIANVAKEVGSDFSNADGVVGGVKSLYENAKAMGSGIVAQMPNMVLPMAGMLGGGAAGTVAGGPIGTVAGGFAGASAGNTIVGTSEAAMRHLQVAGINPEDTNAVAEYFKNNSGSILGETAIKGSVIGAVDTATMGLGHFLLTGPGKQAASRALTGMGIDLADKAAVNSALKSQVLKDIVAKDAAYIASKTGAQNVARNVGAAALEPAGEFAGEYAGSLAATGQADAKDAALEAFSSLGQSAVTFAGQKAYASAPTPDPLRIGNTPDPMIGFPDGTVARRSEVEAYINSLPEDQRVAARAKLQGLEKQPVKPDDILETQSAADAISTFMESVSKTGQDWQNLGVTPTGETSLLSSYRAGQEWQSIAPEQAGSLEQQRAELEREGAALSQARDARLADVGQQWQDLGITNPADDLQAQRMGMREEPNGVPTGVLLADSGRNGQDGNLTTESVGTGVGAERPSGLQPGGLENNFVGELDKLPGEAPTGPVDERLVPLSKRNVQNNQAPANEPKAEATPDAQAQAVGANTNAAEPAPGTGTAKVEANGVAPKQGPGAPLANGFFAGPVEGEKFRVSDVSATGGLTLDKRLSGGTVSTMYVGADGGFVDAENVNMIGDGVARLWKPLTDLARQAAREILQEMGALPLGNKRREELKAKLKEVVANDGKPPAIKAPSTTADSDSGNEVSQSAQPGLPGEGAGVSPAEDKKAKWLKAINDQNRLMPVGGVQLTVQNGKLTFMGNPDSSKQGKALQATLAEAQKAGASIAEIIASIQAPEAMAGDAAAPADVPGAGSTAVQADGVRQPVASWVIREKETGNVVMETYDKAKVDALNTKKYEAVPIEQHLNELNQKIKADGVKAAIEQVTTPISYEDAKSLVAGKTEKPGGTDPVRQIDAGEGNKASYRIGNVPISMFKENESGNRYDGTVNESLATDYSKRDASGAPPVIAVLSPKTGKLNILDGGHRITAARMRGDETISTLISFKTQPTQPITGEGAGVAKPKDPRTIKLSQRTESTNAQAPKAIEASPPAQTSQAEVIEPNFEAAKALIKQQKAATGNKSKENLVRIKLRQLAAKTPINHGKTVSALDIAATRLGMGEGKLKGLEFAPEEQPQAPVEPAQVATETVAKPRKKPAGGKTLRSKAYDKNPLLTFLATHGLFHDKTKPGSHKVEFSPDKAIMVMGYGPVFKKTGKRLDELTQNAIEEGYLPTDGTESQLRELVRRAVAGEKISPLYAEGVAEQIAEQNFAEHLAQQQEAAQNEDFDDPFGPMLDGDFVADDFDVPGYDEASDPIKLEVNALLALADDAGINEDAREAIKEDAHYATLDQSEQAYYEAYRNALKAAIAASNRVGSADSGEASNAQGQREASPPEISGSVSAVQSSQKALEAGQAEIDEAKGLKYKLPYLEDRLKENLDPTDGFDMHILANELPPNRAYNRMMTDHNGDFSGVEFKNKDGRHAFVLPDASQPGKWRVSYFDKDGFSRHESEPTREKAQQSLARDGYTIEDKGALDRLASTKEWARGTDFAGLIFQLNSGAITHAQFIEKQNKLNADYEASKGEGLTLTAPSRQDVLAQQAAIDAEAKRKEEGGDKPIPRKQLTGDIPDLFNPQGSVFDVPEEPTPQPKPLPSWTPPM